MYKCLEHIKFSKEAEWLKPFVTSTKNLVPLDKLRAIRVYKTPISKQEDSEGLIDRSSRGNFIIRIRVTEHCFKTLHDKPLTLELSGREPRMLWFMLSAAAHELSHLVHWEHDTDHLRLENRIMLKFCQVLDKKNIQDLYKRGAV